MALRDKVLAECQQWANTEANLADDNPPKTHPSGWEIWAVEDYYEFHREDDGEYDFFDYYPNSEDIEDRSDKAARLLGITYEEVKP